MLVAPALAGFLVGQTGARVPLLLDAASYLALVAVGFLIRTRRHGTVSGEVTETVEFRLRSDRSLTVMTVAIAAVVAGVGAINVFDVFFVRETLGASATTYGLVTAAWTIGMVLVSPFLGRVPHRWLTVRTVLAMLAGACLAVLVGATVGGAAWLIPLWILGGACNGGINVFVMVIVAGRAPAAAHGRAFAMVSAAIQGAALIGLLAAGPLVEQFDPRWLLAAAGGLGLLAALAAMPIVRRARTIEVAADSPTTRRNAPVAA